jgi:hypothetical protein
MQPAANLISSRDLPAHPTLNCSPSPHQGTLTNQHHVQERVSDTSRNYIGLEKYFTGVPGQRIAKDGWANSYHRTALH